MNLLFDFLISNAFILVIVIGFIFNIFKRYGEQSKTDQKTKRSLEPKRSEIDIRKEVERAKQFKKQSASIQAKLEEAKALSKPKPVLHDRQTSAPLLTVKAQRIRESRAKKTLSFSKKQVVQGVIWSEILSPPKAKRK
ncbi:hypothetical protein [Priestia abyssalis]|uniref:hypothetical protein n=1 Tax=Priestia abyssalis TaxID=1221450 RepID=UPI000994CA2C|nr:hypothetical protein [Priestia abyssalis]